MLKKKMNVVPYTKINPKWLTDLNVKPKTIKLIKRNIGENLCNLMLDEDSLDMTPKAYSIEE